MDDVINFIYPWISKSALYMLSPELNYIQVKFGVNPFISFELTGENVILYRWSILNGNGNGSSWLVLHFQVLADSIDLTWHYVAKSSHLTANVMTDRHTGRHTDTQTDKPSDVGEKHNTFFQRYNKASESNQSSMGVFWSREEHRFVKKNLRFERWCD